MQLISALGLDWKVFLAQLVNFTILYLLIKKFALGKIIALMDKRQQVISEGLENAQKAEKTLAQATEKEAAVIAKARTEAKEIIGEARGQAKVVGDKVIADAKEQANKIVKNARAAQRL